MERRGRLEVFLLKNGCFRMIADLLTPSGALLIHDCGSFGCFALATARTNYGCDRHRSFGASFTRKSKTPEKAASEGLAGRAYARSVNSLEVLIVGRVPPNAMVEVSEAELEGGCS